ncbi:hypothetical protein BXZ70DRAFT_327929 [Cristinia sonorae]|uniref:Retrovirus-related Pol polyprotein from transposon TNT 1-94-like beta-barrel domain-containing protein n=1 Tax=Cristinia sonorae TaxID=1940300 RepID=A0A8K0XNT5_9AGAR|nr:hypothetical protein BXZ70DRAFT_327929 [Cristinia sonorae]
MSSDEHVALGCECRIHCPNRLWAICLRSPAVSKPILAMASRFPTPLILEVPRTDAHRSQQHTVKRTRHDHLSGSLYDQSRRYSPSPSRRRLSHWDEARATAYDAVDPPLEILNHSLEVGYFGDTETYSTFPPTHSFDVSAASWYIDTSDAAYTHHISNDRRAFRSFTPCIPTFVNDDPYSPRIHGYGTVKINSSPTGRPDCIITLLNVAYCPDAACNTISSTIIESKGCEIVPDLFDRTFLVFNSRFGTVDFEGTFSTRSSLHALRCTTRFPSRPPCKPAIVPTLPSSPLSQPPNSLTPSSEHLESTFCPPPLPATDSLSNKEGITTLVPSPPVVSDDILFVNIWADHVVSLDAAPAEGLNIPDHPSPPSTAPSSLPLYPETLSPASDGTSPVPAVAQVAPSDDSHVLPIPTIPSLPNEPIPPDKLHPTRLISFIGNFTRTPSTSFILAQQVVLPTGSHITVLPLRGCMDSAFSFGSLFTFNQTFLFHIKDPPLFHPAKSANYFPSIIHNF